MLKIIIIVALIIGFNVAKPISINVITEVRIPLPSFERISKRNVVESLPLFQSLVTKTMENEKLNAYSLKLKLSKPSVLKDEKEAIIQDEIERDYREAASKI